MPPRRPKAAPAGGTPLAEWIAAGLGLVVTAGVIGYTLWDGLTDDAGPPQLSVRAERPSATPAGFVVPIIVRNASHATAADVEVVGRTTPPGQASDERRAILRYVPGRGEARGGLVFRTDPGASPIDVSVEGYADP